MTRQTFVFKQYISGKAHKHRVKMYKLVTTTNGYTWNLRMYNKEQNRIHLNITYEFLNCYFYSLQISFIINRLLKQKRTTNA